MSPKRYVQFHSELRAQSPSRIPNSFNELNFKLPHSPTLPNRTGAMVRASKKPVTDADDERSRLKKLSISRNILSQTPSNSSTSLNLSKTVLKHHGTDILKKSQRKNRFLFSFPGLLGPLAGGKIGELTDLGTKTPILYLDFPQGRVKMFGTIVYTKNRYLTLQFSKGGKNVMCEDHFDNMVVFSDAWWIGKKDENPEEVQLEFPKNLVEGKHTESDFKGGAGAGAASEKKSSPTKPRKEYVEPESSSADMEDDSEDVGSLTGKNKDLLETTPVRQSSRTAGKKFKFTEASSGDSSADSDSDKSELMKESLKEKLDDVTKDSNLVVDATDSVHDAAKHDILEQQSPFSVKPKEISVSKRAPLVQSTISTLFVKAKAKAKDGARKNKVTPTRGGNSGAGNSTRKKKSQVEDDDIEEFSSESEDIEESDDDWVA